MVILFIVRFVRVCVRLGEIAPAQFISHRLMYVRFPWLLLSLL